MIKNIFKDYEDKNTIYDNHIRPQLGECAAGKL